MKADLPDFRSWAAAVVRTYYSFKIAQGPDITYNIIVQGIAAAIESYIGTIVSSAPVLPRFFQQYGHQISGLFHLARVPETFKRSRHLHLSSALAQEAPCEYPNHFSPSVVPGYDGARMEQISSGDRFLITEDALPLKDILPSGPPPVAAIRK